MARSRASVFFLQAEDGIRDATVTGVQTCALPINDTAHRDATVTGVQTCALPICTRLNSRRHTRCYRDWSSDVCRSEERRVGKESRARWWADRSKKEAGQRRR